MKILTFIVALLVCTILTTAIAKDKTAHRTKICKYNHDLVTSISNLKTQKAKFELQRLLSPAKEALISPQAVSIQAIINDFKVNEDAARCGSAKPSIAVDESGNCMIVWIDERNITNKGTPDIYAQMVNVDGIPQGGNFTVNNEQSRLLYRQPSIASDFSDRFVIVWEDQRDDTLSSNGYIYAQRLDHAGNAIGTNFRVNDNALLAEHMLPAIAMDGSGNFIITWIDTRDGDYDVYAQRYNSAGITQGGNFKVNEVTDNPDQYVPIIAADAAGNFIIAWIDLVHDGSMGTTNVYAQRYNSAGIAQGSNFKASDMTTVIYTSTPAIACDADGNFGIVWVDGRENKPGIYVQRYNSAGIAQGSVMRASDDTTGYLIQDSPSIAADGSGNFIIEWIDSRYEGWDIYAQRYNNSGNTVGRNFRVTKIASFSQTYPDVKLWNGRIYSIWLSDHMQGPENDIWANVLDWNNPTASVDEPLSDHLLPDHFELNQNYPNPFNPETNIDYQIPFTQNVSLTVYDMQGRCVTTLVNETKEAGFYHIQWNGQDSHDENVASGVYFYQLQTAQFMQVGKAIYLK